MKPGKHQRSKQRFEDLCWKVHDRAQSFVLRSYTMHDCVIKTLLLVSYSVSSKQLCVLCTVKANKENKNIQQRTLSSFITIPLY